jgi:hypothetical protein
MDTERAITQRAQQAKLSSAANACDKSRSPSEVEMITYGGESAMLHDDLLNGFPLHISVLNAEQPGRSQQSRRLPDHDLDDIEAVITGEQRDRRIMIAHLGYHGFKSIQGNVWRVRDHQVHAPIELRKSADHVLHV